MGCSHRPACPAQAVEPAVAAGQVGGKARWAPDRDHFGTRDRKRGGKRNEAPAAGSAIAAPVEPLMAGRQQVRCAASIAGSYHRIIETPGGSEQRAHMMFAAAHPTKKSSISIVDDEACVREALSSLIRSMGYMATEYASAEDFLERERLEETSCLILDMRMPGMGGLELQRRLAESGCRIPIVFLSARTSKQEKRRALRAGATDFLSKPVNENALLYAIHAALDARSHQQD